MALSDDLRDDRRPARDPDDHRRPRDVLHRARLQQRHRPAAADVAARSRRRRPTSGADTLQTFRYVTFPAMRIGAARRGAARLRAVVRRGHRHDLHRRAASRRCRSGSSRASGSRTRSPLVNVAGLVAILLSVDPGLPRDAAHSRRRRHGRRPDLSAARTTASSAGRPRRTSGDRDEDDDHGEDAGTPDDRSTHRSGLLRPGWPCSGRLDPVEECPVSDPPPPVWRSALICDLSGGFAPGSVTSTARSPRRGSSRGRPGTRAGSPCRRTSTWCRRARA